MAQRQRWLIPISLMILIAPFTPYLDLTVAKFFYHHGDNNFYSTPLYDFMYQWGVVPGQALGLLSAFWFLFSFVSPFWKRWRREALLCLLTFVVGAGVITHTLLKDHWGRPRPKQTLEFGGIQPFRAFYKPNFFYQPEPSKSFPCGHCSMGFVFFCLTSIAWRYRLKFLLFFSFSFAFLWGALLGVARMAQGGHYLSDVLMSALIMWLTALTLDWLLYSIQVKNERPHQAAE